MCVCVSCYLLVIFRRSIMIAGDEFFSRALEFHGTGRYANRYQFPGTVVAVIARRQRQRQRQRQRRRALLIIPTAAEIPISRVLSRADTICRWRANGPKKWALARTKTSELTNWGSVVGAVIVISVSCRSLARSARLSVVIVLVSLSDSEHAPKEIVTER